MRQSNDLLMRNTLNRIFPHDHRLSHIGINDQNMLAGFSHGARQIQNNRALSLIRNRTGEEDRPHIISAELDIRTQRTHRLHHGGTHIIQLSKFDRLHRQDTFLLSELR